MENPVNCWNCGTLYDYSKHEVCPVCDVHFLDGGRSFTTPAEGSRVNIEIDYAQEKILTTNIVE